MKGAVVPRLCWELAAVETCRGHARPSAIQPRTDPDGNNMRFKTGLDLERVLTEDSRPKDSSCPRPPMSDGVLSWQGKELEHSAVQEAGLQKGHGAANFSSDVFAHVMTAWSLTCPLWQIYAAAVGSTRRTITATINM